jgi:hypothetical protein
VGFVSVYSNLNFLSFFKPEIKQNIEQSSTQTNQSSLKYLLCNYDHPMNNVSSGFSAGDYMLYYLV